MSTMRELVEDGVNKEIASFDSNTSMVGLKYVIISDKDEIEVSEHESILDRPDIKYSFTFIEVRYSPKVKYYASYLAPIIVSHDLKVSHGQLVFGNWVVNYKGQSLKRKPYSLKFKIVDHKSRELTTDYFSIEPASLIMSFEKAYNLWMAIGECTSRGSALLVIDHFKKEDTITKKGLIDELMEEISALRIKLETRDQLLEKYKQGLDQLGKVIFRKGKS